MTREVVFERLEYYELLSKSRQVDREGKNWRSSVYCKRIDTGEYIKYCQLYVEAPSLDEARASAEQRAKSELVPKLSALGKPLDWQSEVRRILLAAYKSKTTFGRTIAQGVQAPLDEDKLLSDFGLARENYLKESIGICRRLEELSGGQRIEALTSPDDVFVDPSNSWSLQDLEMRIDIYKYLLNPTQAETSAHQDQLRRLRERYDELGW